MQVIEGGYVLQAETLDIVRGDIVVEGDTICDILPPGALEASDVKRVDATDRVLIPGLVNGHNHAQTGLAKGLFDRYNLELFLNAAPWANGRRTLEDKYLSATIGATELVRKGCTASYDMFAEFPLPTVEGVKAVAQAYSDVGMRATVATMMADKSFYEAVPGLLEAIPESVRKLAEQVKCAPNEHAIAACRRILQGWQFDKGRVRPALGPTIPHHCTDEFLLASRDLAKEYGVGMQMHVAESRMQAVVALRKYGKSLVSHLDSLGMLSPHFCVAHGVWLDDEDLQRLANQGASLSHNPGSNLKLGSGIADLRGMLDRKVNVAIGTDGAAASDNLNVFEAMRLASYLSRVQGYSPDRWIDAREAFRACTEGGAKALGFDRIGRLEVGYKADIVFIDLSAMHYVPLNNFIQQLVFAEDGTGVDSVMVGGTTIMWRGELLTVDIPSLRRRAESAIERLTLANSEARAAGERLAPYVGHFCSGLAASPLMVHRFCGHAR